MNPQYIETIVYINGDQCYVRSTAVLEILKEFGYPLRFLVAFKIVPEFLRDFVYNIIARTRYRLFGRRDSCAVYPENLMSRFLK